MSSAEKLLFDTPAPIFERVVPSADNIIVSSTSPKVIESLIETINNIGSETPSVTVLSNKQVLQSVTSDFLTASIAADHVEDNQLALRTTEPVPSGESIVTDSSLTAILIGRERFIGLQSEDPELVESAYEDFDAMSSTSEQFSIRTPGLSRLRDTMQSTFSDTTEEDFMQMLQAANTGRKVDEVIVALLVAAKHQLLFYDISRWGEDVGFASSATFSRVKTSLEDQNIIETEKEPIEVGRPRQRLLLSGDELPELNGEELVKEVFDHLIR